MSMNYFVYILKNESGRFYIGVSEDVEVRLKQHNDGISKWTAKYRPWKIVWSREFESLGEARKYENQLKKSRKRLYFFGE